MQVLHKGLVGVTKKVATITLATTSLTLVLWVKF